MYSNPFRLEAIDMSENQFVEQTDNPSTLCKVSQLSRISGLDKEALRRYNKSGLLRPEVTLDSGHHLYTRHDLIQLERLALMKMIGLSHSQIKECLSQHDRELREELRLQKEILLEKRRRLNRAIYFMEYAEEVNRNPQSGDWHYLARVIEAVTSLRDPESFRRFYMHGKIQTESPAARPHDLAPI
jgi:DNA-binding transcriptional MerR regulator